MSDGADAEPAERTPAPAPIGLTYVGHATLLIEIDGLRVLTDPLLRGRIGHLLRRAPPPPAELLSSPIDLILISHAHHDHLDVPSLRRLAAAGTVVICPRPARRATARAGFEPRVVSAGDASEHGPVRVEAVPAYHDGRRWPTSRSFEALGYVVRGGSGSVYFAGDTGLFGGLAELSEIDVALLPVAGWGPRLDSSHLDPEAAAEAAAMIEPRVAVPIHWGSYRRMLTGDSEPADAPPRRFLARLAELCPEVRGELIEPGASHALELRRPG